MVSYNRMMMFIATSKRTRIPICTTTDPIQRILAPGSTKSQRQEVVAGPVAKHPFVQLQGPAYSHGRVLYSAGNPTSDVRTVFGVLEYTLDAFTRIGRYLTRLA